ncbi:MAG: protein kinase [Dokdonella sp.]
MSIPEIPNPTSLRDLINRLTAGESVDTASIPDALRNDPSLQRLLQIARVAEVFDRNFETEEVAAEQPSQLGPWRLLRLLGTGGMGEVWLGERSDEIVEQRVAIKRVRFRSSDFRDRLFSERRILARLEHPNIAHFIDAGVDQSGSPWLVLEYVEGIPITDWCAQSALSLRQRLELFRKVCAAVAHAHRHLVVHRDLKPANVLINADGEPKLLDFGIAKLLDGSDEGNTIGALTPAYAAPEQLRGEAVSTATDVYALGLLLFRLLAGSLPPTRKGHGAAAMLAMLDDEETQRPSRCAELDQSGLPYSSSALRGDLDAIVAQALRARPENRYGSVVELSSDIERHLDARPVLARIPSRRYRLARFARRNRLAVSLGTLVVVVLVGGSLVSMRQAQRATHETESAQRELARAERVSGFLASLFREQDPLNRDGSDLRRPQVVLADAVTRVDRELLGDAQTRAQLLRVLGEAQLNLADLDAARTTLDLAAECAHKASDDLLGADIDSLRGALELREFHQDPAEALFRTARDTAVRLRGADSLEVARIEARQAWSLVSLGKFKDASGAAEHAHSVLGEKLGPADRESIAALVTLGVIEEQLREDKAALATLRSAIGLIEANFGGEDARLVTPLQTLGEVLRRARDFDTARSNLERGVTIARTRFGAKNSRVSAILIRLAGVERDAGNMQHAITLLDEAETALPEADEASLAQILNTRGSIRIELGDGLQAEADYRRSLDLHRSAGDRRSGVMWFSQAQVGTALALQGHFAEALQLQLESADEVRKLLGPDAYQNALIAVRLAQTYSKKSDFRNAVAQWREALRLIEKTYGRDHFGHFDWSLELARSLESIPDSRSEAAAILDDLITRWHGNPKIAESEASLVLLRCKLHVEAGRVDAAAALARSSLARKDFVANEEEGRQLQEYARN